MMVPKVCLNMIVKNESKIITRLLESVAPYIDSYCICDTGSVDNTEELIKDFFANHCNPPKPGKITHEPFKDFAHNRSFSLKACEGMENADYVLLLDADMVFWTNYTPEEFRLALKHDVYLVMQGCDTFMYKNVRIVRNNRGMHYWGVTHEYVVIPDGNSSDLLNWRRVFIKDIGDGGSKADKYERDIRLLKKGLEDKPNDERYTFYLANSYYCLMKFDEAIPIYQKRAELGGFGEEVWYSLFRVGECYRHKGDIANAVHWYLNAYQYSDYRCENLYEVVKMYREKGQSRLAKLYYEVADAIRKKGKHDDHLFTAKDVYEFRLDYEKSIFGYFFKEEEIPRDELRKTCMNLLNHPHFDIVGNIMSNFKFYAVGWVKEYCVLRNNSSSPIIENGLERLKNVAASITELSTSQKVKDLVISKMEKDYPFWSSTPSLTALPGSGVGSIHEWVVNLRFVNYRIGDRGEYINQKHIQTVNIMAEIDARGMLKQDSICVLDYDTSLDAVYKGLEDVRLFCPYPYNETSSVGMRILDDVSGDAADVVADSDDETGEGVRYRKNVVIYNANRGLDHTPYGNHQRVAVECGKIGYEYPLDAGVGGGASKTLDGHLIHREGMTAVEKNWVYLPLDTDASESGKPLKMIYNWNPLVIGEVYPPSSETESRLGMSYEFKKIKEIASPHIFKMFRGSTNGIRVGDEIWFLCHIVSYEDRRYYYHSVVALDAETYEPVRYSKFFTFENQKVEYSLGMTLETCVFDFDRPVTKEYLMFGYSLMDNVSKTCVIPVEQFKKDFISLR